MSASSADAMNVRPGSSLIQVSSFVKPSRNFFLEVRPMRDVEHVIRTAVVKVNVNKGSVEHVFATMVAEVKLIIKFSHAHRMQSIFNQSITKETRAISSHELFNSIFVDSSCTSNVMFIDHHFNYHISVVAHLFAEVIESAESRTRKQTPSNWITVT